MKLIAKLFVLIMIGLSCSCNLPPEERRLSEDIQLYEAIEESKVRGINQPRVEFIKEIKTELPDKISSNNKCVKTLREFMSYIFSNSPNLFYNEEARRKWLSKGLRNEMANNLEDFLKYGKTKRTDFPDNTAFIGAWDYPTTYKIVSLEQKEDVKIINLIYEWGQGTNYAGDKRSLSYMFIEEEGNCKVQDIYHHKGKSITAFSLSDSLRGNSFWSNINIFE